MMRETSSHALQRHATMHEYTMVSSGILPPLGAISQISRRPKLQSYIISPFNYRYRIWEIYLVVLVFYTAWVCPFEFGFFGSAPKGVLSIIDNIVNGCFAIDIVLTFFVAYVDKATYELVDNHKQIGLRYAKTWLAFDVISTVPTELFRLILPKSFSSYEYFNLFRLWRLRRVSAMFARLEKDINYRYIWIRVSKLLCVTLFVAHCGACVMNLVAIRYPDPTKTWMYLTMEDFHERTKWARYVASFYWSITTLTTSGYGDLHAVNHLEMALDSWYMIISMGIDSYVLGNMTSLVVQMTNKTMQFRKDIEAATSFAKRNQLPDRLREQMISHLCLKYKSDKEGHQQEILEALPKAIRSSISNYLFYPLLDNAYLFRGVSKDLLFQVVSEMKAEYFPPREDVILQNEAPTDLYIIVTGAVELIVRQNAVDQVVGEAKNGDIIGEIGVLCYKPQPFTVRTTRLSQLLRMNRAAFINIIRANVGDGTVIMDNLLQHLKDLKDPVSGEILNETEQMIAKGKTDVPLSLIFGAVRGDDMLMRQLLRKGSDPNEIDSVGQTALHICASKGNDHCVAILLEYGADPNMRDFQGNVPLWNAILGKHKKLSKLLADNGAKLSSGDTGQFACTAAEQNNLELLKEIVRYGGDVKLPNTNGTTALHAATSEGNIEMVKFLLEEGGDIDKSDNYGWTARALADHQGHDHIKTLFENTPPKATGEDPKRPPKLGAPYLGRQYSRAVLGGPSEGLPAIPEVDTPISARQMDISSPFGLMSPEEEEMEDDTFMGPARVVISCPEKEEIAGKLVVLPECLEEVLDMGLSKFGIRTTRVLNEEGSEIDDIELIRDGDHLVLATAESHD